MLVRLEPTRTREAQPGKTLKTRLTKEKTIKASMKPVMMPLRTKHEPMNQEIEPANSKLKTRPMNQTLETEPTITRMRSEPEISKMKPEVLNQEAMNSMRIEKVI